MALSAERPSDQIGERLAKLTGGKQKIERLVDTHRGELAKMRTIQTTAKGAPGTANFLLLMSPSSTVEDVRFIGGDEALKPFADYLQKASYPKMFPDSVPAKLLRRGVLFVPGGERLHLHAAPAGGGRAGQVDRCRARCGNVVARKAAAHVRAKNQPARHNPKSGGFSMSVDRNGPVELAATQSPRGHLSRFRVSLCIVFIRV